MTEAEVSRVSVAEVKEYIATLTREEKCLLYALLKSLKENPQLLRVDRRPQHENL